MNKGFTLMEALIVIIISLILMTFGASFIASISGKTVKEPTVITQQEELQQNNLKDLPQPQHHEERNETEGNKL